MRAQLSSLHERLGVTTVYVTHDQIEAMTLGTRVAVLKDGELMQVDTPQMLFDAPDNLFVATFIGSPAMNLAEAKLVRDQGPTLLFAELKVPLPEQLVSAREGLDSYFDKQLIVGLRPSSMEDAAVRPRRLASGQGRGRGHRGARLGGQPDLPHGRPPDPSRHHDRPVRQGGQGRGRGRGAGRGGPWAVDRPGQPQDPGPGRPDRGAGRGHRRVPLLRQGHPAWPSAASPKAKAPGNGGKPRPTTTGRGPGQRRSDQA